MVHELSRTDARRVAVRAQLLANPRPTDLLEMVRHLTVLQRDPTATVAPNADLVAWSRLGDAFAPVDLDAAIEAGELVELEGFLRPATDLRLFRAEMARWRGEGGELANWQEAALEWVEVNDECRRDILDRLRDEGPLPTRDLPDTTVVPWRSSGWNEGRNVRLMVEQLVRRGEVAVAGRDGRAPLWDLAERVYPDTETVPWPEAVRIRAQRRLRALGIARPKSTAVPGEPNDVGETGEPATVEGLRGTWRVDPVYLEELENSNDPSDVFPGRTVLLSPLDRLVFDRKRMADLFDFDYQLEMYKPAAKRRWGYWALPVLHGDRLVGKVDAQADLDAGLLRVHAIHEDGGWPPAIRTAVHREIRALAHWLELEPDLPN
ncbi:DNA glycosylase AlkZ-like family protein [Georgenia deserti]|uniref:DNA glycosylase AlkZ-like family protein n=1 Tax=Georgenia deserti TaxID=2093781 RepID=A0ABW4L6N1_9MICO